MEIGSVKFWRHVIVGTIVGLIVVLFLIVVGLGIHSFRLSRHLKDLNQQVASADVSDTSSVEPDGDWSDSSTEPQAEPTDPISDADMPAYTELFPDLYADYVVKNDDNTQKVVYLTFDDGPSSEVTAQVLDNLDEAGVKATFFVTAQFGNKEFRAEMYREILNRGHTLAIHTYSHDYKTIYSSVEDYLKDMNEIYQEIYEATGYRVFLIRFPGGSVNSYNPDIYRELIAEVTRRGFTFCDWTISAEDAVGGNPSSGEIIDRLVEGCEKYNKSIVLCHDTDGQATTAQAIVDTVEILSSEGYSFKAIEPNIRPIHFHNIS